SFSNGAHWSSWEQYTRTVFATLEQNFANGWLGKVHLNHQINGYDAPLGAVAAGNPNPVTGSGTRLWLNKYDGETKADAADMYLTGPFELFGKEHELVAGGSISRKRWQSKTYNRPTSYSNLVDGYYQWDGNIPEPDWQFSHRYDE